MVVVLLLLMSGVAVGKSSMLFQAGKNELEGVSCLPGLSTAALQDMVTDMSSLPSIMDRLLPNILVQRVSGTSGNARVREFIKDEMRSLGWLVEEDTFRDRTPFGVVTFSNIIATMNPQATKRLVIACHYDSKYMPGSVPFVGASDSAVPCSIMMDTARQLNRISKYMHNPAQDTTLQLIFFDGEEAFVRWTFFDSLYGSRHLASLWESSPDGNDPMAANNLANIDFFVLLDLIGTSDTRFVNYYSNTSQLFHQLVSIEQCLKTNKLLSRKSSRAIFNPLGRAQIVEDDHIPFINRGVRVLHLISTPFPRVWHTVYDNLSYLDTALIDDFSRILRIFLTSVLYRI